MCRGSAITAVGLLIACRQDMHNQPKEIPLRPSTFFADGTSARPLVPGTVPRHPLHQDQPTPPAGASRQDGLAASMAVLTRGRERFDIFCAPCHGRLGTGDGMIARRGFRRPTSLHSDRLRQAPAGHFFDIITNGFGAMPAYAEQVPPEDRWAIASYLRALQRSQSATLADVPAAARAQLGPPDGRPAP